MKIKENIQLILFILIVIMAISSIPLYLQSKDDKHNKLMYEGVVGHTLFQIYSNYESIKVSDQQPTIEEIRDVHERLCIIQGYSETIDFTYNTPLLLPISKSLTHITDQIISNYNQNHSLSKADLENMSIVYNESKNIIPLIVKVYYVPGQNSESPKVRKKLSEFDDLTTLHQRIRGIG